LGPLDLAGRQLHAAKLRLLRVAAARPVDVAVEMDRRHPVRGHRLVALAAAGPDHVDAARLHFEHRAAHAVALGDHHEIAHDHRVARVHALQDLRAPRILEVDLAGRRLEADQAAAAEDEAPATVADGRDHRAGVARQLVGDIVLDLAAPLVDRDDAAAVALHLVRLDPRAVRRAAADLDDQQLAFDDRRAADAEEIL